MRQTWRGLCTHGSKVPDAPSPSGAPLSGRGRRSTLPEQRGLAYSPLTPHPVSTPSSSLCTLPAGQMHPTPHTIPPTPDFTPYATLLQHLLCQQLFK